MRGGAAVARLAHNQQVASSTLALAPTLAAIINNFKTQLAVFIADCIILPQHGEVLQSAVFLPPRANL